MEDDQLFQKAKILIIADDAHAVVPLTDILSMSDTQLRLAASQQAIAVYHDWSPDLVILDLRMRFDSGLVLLEQLNRFARDGAPILALTAFAAAGSRQAVLKAGAKDFLTLPCDTAEAVVRVRNLLEMRCLHQYIQQPHAAMASPIRPQADEQHESQIDLFQRLGRLVARRDRATGTHVLRMSRYAAVLGRAAGLTETESKLLQQASPMHDIGKIGIPDRILLKPSSLEPEEWAIMQTHTTIGTELLSRDGSALMRMAHDAALTHHEKWDGSGYPQGLSGESIPLVGRITAICDVFDALTSQRPYKPAWPVADAVAEIRQQSGRQFEPRLVKTFCLILPELLEIKQEYAEPRTAA